MTPVRLHGVVALALLLLIALPVAAVPLDGPVAHAYTLQIEDALPVIDLPSVDRQQAAWEDEDREILGLPYRFAEYENVLITPDNNGLWESLDPEYDLWRLRIRAPGSLTLNLGFTAYYLPEGARLSLYPTRCGPDVSAQDLRRFDHRDNETHGQLWTPVVLTDDLIVELLMPRAARSEYMLVLESINKGYRFFGETSGDKEGDCHIDVTCPMGDEWRTEINTVGVYTLGGNRICSGLAMNNTALDATPYFVSAKHCGVTSYTALSMVVYWNYQRPCGSLVEGSLEQYQTGATFLAAADSSDFVMALLDDPLNPDYDVALGGWDRSDAVPTSAVAIHHPGTSEKRISFEYDPLSIATYFQDEEPGDGTHLRVADWDVGTTEPGSSGSPLYDQNHHFVGQLHGGWAACINDLPDWYGRFFKTWPHVTTYLDPLGTGAVTLDTYQPPTPGIRITADSIFNCNGPLGGPFTALSTTYLLENRSTGDLEYQVTSDMDWLDIGNAGGTVTMDSTIEITATVNALADDLPYGLHDAVVSFTNLSDGIGNASRVFRLKVGLTERLFQFTLDEDPGWSTEGDWAFGPPLGLGGSPTGSAPDPSSACSGFFVYGYNLAGNYAPDMPPTHLTTSALDCTNLHELELRFKRWLGVMDYDRASISISTDAQNFSPVWENPSSIADLTWQDGAHILGPIADDQPELYIRWTMGPTQGGTFQLCGWNIDDIEIWGVRSVILSTDDRPDEPRDLPTAEDYSLRNDPNPFNPRTRISFSLPRAGRTQLAIFDLLGRRVRVLVDGYLEAGPHVRTWDGLDDTGQTLGSGTYLSRLSTEGRFMQTKMLLIK